MKILFGPIYIIIVIGLALHFYLGAFSAGLVVWAAVYLIFKGTLFSIIKQRLISLLDMFCGVYFLVVILHLVPNTLITLLPIIYLAEKGISYTWVGLRA
ncbi:MAG TPA: hypothetical protein VJA47_02130 [archaeon]|nr:hypothetical protein [archaeon]